MYVCVHVCKSIQGGDEILNFTTLSLFPPLLVQTIKDFREAGYKGAVMCLGATYNSADFEYTILHPFKIQVNLL